jgi:hypothetical protein
MINKFLSDNLAPPGVEYDYGDYTGAGFPQTQPITELKAQEFRGYAVEILAAEYLQKKERSKRIRNQRDKDIKAARLRFAYKMIVEHDQLTYTWSDGLSVRIENPVLRSGGVPDAASPMRVVFNR